MSRHRKMLSCNSNKVLGKCIEQFRIHEMDLTQKHFAKKIRVTQQRLDKYEKGEDLVPIAMLENIAIAFGNPIPKKLIRKIMKIRHMDEVERRDYLEDLSELYEEAFELDDFDEG